MNINRLLKQTAVYWGSPVANGYGAYTYAYPVEVVCRWKEGQELFLNPAGKEQVSDGIVYTNQDLVANGYLYLGELADLDSDPSDPTVVVGAKEIRATGKVPGLKAVTFLRKYWL